MQTPLRGLGINSREAKLRLSFLQTASVHSIPCWVSRAQATGAAAVLLGLCPSGRRSGGVDVFVSCIRRPSQRAVDVTTENPDGDRRFGATSWPSAVCCVSSHQPGSLQSVRDSGNRRNDRRQKVMHDDVLSLDDSAAEWRPEREPPGLGRVERRCFRRITALSGGM